MIRERNAREKWGSLLLCGLVFLVIVVFGVVALYLFVFNDGLSERPDSWSAFGSYLGGVLGPIVSLVTLFAILRTIGLQLEQSEHFVSEGIQQRIAEYKSSQLQLLDQQINMYERMIDSYNQEGARVLELSKATGISQGEHLRQLDKAIQDTENGVGKLLKLSVEVSLSEYESVDELRKRMVEELRAIHPTFYAIKKFDCETAS